MYASHISINKFRRFTNTRLKIGKYVTCIAGQNGVGKSQVLALLGNCGQLAQKQGESIQGYPFRADWSEIVKGDMNHDNLKSVKDALSIHFEDLPKTDELAYFKYAFSSDLSFRTLWQNKSIDSKDAGEFLKSVTSDELKQKINKNIDNLKDSSEKKINVPDRFRIIPMKNESRHTESK